jgi:hypothetical protein
MNKQFHEHKRLDRIRAGDIARHPEHQRKSPIGRFEKRLGQFDLGKCVELIHVVANPHPGPKWLAIDGATRVEACLKNKKHGPDTTLDCRVYGNGKPPSGQELDELFLLLNADHISVGAGVQFERAVGAKRRSAVFAAGLIDKLGPRFKASTGVWRMVERYGEAVAEAAVDFAIDTWGIEQPMPGQIIKALATIYSDPEQIPNLKKRRTAISKSTPENIRLRAQQRMLTQVGKRDDLNTWTVRVLMGKRA